MPNHCESDLFVWGSWEEPEDLKKFTQYNDGNPLGANAYIPKWTLYDVEVIRPLKEDECSVAYTFRTAWTPPNLVIVALSKAFPSLKFELHSFEASGGYYQFLIVEGGKIMVKRVESYEGYRGG